MHHARLYHNKSSCSKCRGALEILRERGVEPDVIDLVATPLTETDLRDILRRLDCPARDVLRTGEPDYTSLELDRPDVSDDEIIAAMTRHPALIERPIFVVGDRAVIGRPPERVLELLDA